MSDPQKRSVGMFVKAALILSLLFGIAHIAGFRSYTSVWSGVIVGTPETELAGILYIVLFLLLVCLVPILLIASIILWIHGVVAKNKSTRTTKKDSSPRPYLPT
jgi:hypothetical protein